MKTTVILCLCLFILTLSGLPAYAQEKTTIEFWHAMRQEKKDAINTLAEQFMKENPNIIIKTRAIVSPDVRLHGNDYACLYRQLIQGVALNTPPDVAQVYENWTTQFVEINAITPASYFDKTPYALSNEDKKDFFDIFRNACSYNGVMWTIPFNKSIYVMYYNQDILDSIGAHPPKTWNELKDISMKVTEKQGKFGISYVPTVDIMGHMLYSNNGHFIDSANNAVFNSTAGIESLKYWIQLTNDKSASPSFSAYKDFVNGKSAILLETTSRIGALKQECRFKYGIALLPSGKSRLYQCAGTNLAVFSKDEAKKLAAWKFVKFLSKTENNIAFSIQTGYLPTRHSTFNSPKYQKYLNEFPGYRVGVDALKYGVTQPRTAAWESVRGFVSDAVLEAMSEGAPPEEALNKAAEYSNGLLQGFK